MSHPVIADRTCKNENNPTYTHSSFQIEREGIIRQNDMFFSRYSNPADGMSANSSRPNSRSSQHSSPTMMTNNVSYPSHPSSFRPTTSRRGGRAATPCYYRISNLNPNCTATDPPMDTTITVSTYTESESEANHRPEYFSFHDQCEYDTGGEISDWDRRDIQSRSTQLNPPKESRKRNHSGEKNLSYLINRGDPLLSTDQNEDFKRVKSCKPRFMKKSTFDSDDNCHKISRPLVEDESSYSHLKILPSFSHEEFQSRNDTVGSKSSVFRTKVANFCQEEIDAHKILLSMGSSTFEEEKKSGLKETTPNVDDVARKDTDTPEGKSSSPLKVLFTNSSLPFGNAFDSQLEYPSSPDEPPRIQSQSNHQTLFFDQQASPISNQVDRDSVNSFPRLNRSFDYLVDNHMDVLNAYTPTKSFLKQGKHLDSLKGAIHLSQPLIEFNIRRRSMPPHQWQQTNHIRMTSSGFFHSGDPHAFTNNTYSPNQTTHYFPGAAQYPFNHEHESTANDNRITRSIGKFIHHQILNDLTFILPRLKSHNLDEELMENRNIESSVHGNISISDLNIARHRIKSAVCAFGGCVRKTILDKSVEDNEFYKVKLLERFRESEHRLSWDCEESPSLGNNVQTSNTPQSDEAFKNSEQMYPPIDCLNHDPPISDPAISIGVQTQDPFTSPTRDVLQHLRYHCRMCGQIKLNHVCPILKSLQRSIGVMVYPAVNAFAASEPGRLAPSLSVMNNFVTGSMETTEKTPSRLPMSDPIKRKDGDGKTLPQYVTPETIQRGVTGSIEDTPSHDSFSPQRMARRQPQSAEKNIERKRSHEYEDVNSIIENTHFMSLEVDLKPEQYRVARVERSDNSYVYPPIPLPYSQRKQLSNYLLNLSTSCSSELRDECAVVLKEGREKGMWDLAVAELLAQVLMLVHCHASDVRLDGLSCYLRTIGISC